MRRHRLGGCNDSVDLRTWGVYQYIMNVARDGLCKKIDR